MPHKSLIIGWTLLILPPGDFGDLYRVSNPKTPWHPRKVTILCPLGQSQVYFHYTTGVYQVFLCRDNHKPRAIIVFFIIVRKRYHAPLRYNSHWQPWLGSNQQRRSHGGDYRNCPYIFWRQHFQLCSLHQIPKSGVLPLHYRAI